MWNNIKSFFKLVVLDPIKHVLMWLCNLLNILEPDVPYPVLSISKIAAWGTTFSTIYITIMNPESQALAASVAAQTAAMANYAYRRWVQYRTGTGAYKTGSLSTPPEG